MFSHNFWMSGNPTLFAKPQTKEDRQRILFSKVLKDIPLAVKCHNCGLFELQVSLRGVAGRFCTKGCMNEFYLDRSKRYCFFKECKMCPDRTGRTRISRVLYTAFCRDQMIRLNGCVFWPMMAKKRCDNECIKQRKPVALPSSWEISLQRQGVKRKLNFT